MMRSMFSGVSSLRVHQTKMDVIANNIANVNTIGYKSSSAEFAEVFSQTLQGASSSAPGRGGTNPMQVGLGSTISSISVNTRQGAAQRTDNPTDLLINGEGFFVVTDDPTFQNKLYTRAGNFKMTETGHLTTPDGLLVLGTDMKPIVVDRSLTAVGEATKNVRFTQNLGFAEELKKDSNVAYTAQIDVYDSLGITHPLKVEFGQKLIYKGANPEDRGSFRNVKFMLGEKAGAENVKGNNNALLDVVNGVEVANALYAHFDEEGRFVKFVKIAAGDINTGEGVIQSFTDAADDDLTLKYDPPGAEPMELNLNKEGVFKNLTHFNMSSDVTGDALDGKSAGKVDEFNISNTGEVVVSFTNGVKKVESILSMVKFDNPMGLGKVGSNRFIDTPNSGKPRFSQAGSNGLGVIMAGATEMSNVDLSQEFTDMITTQRGFQANSRIITASDEMLQELVSLKR